MMQLNVFCMHQILLLWNSYLVVLTESFSTITKHISRLLRFIYPGFCFHLLGSFSTTLFSEIWEALRAAAEADLTLAQAIVDSAGVIVQNPDLTICYDERGLLLILLLYNQFSSNLELYCRCQVWSPQICSQWAYKSDPRKLRRRTLQSVYIL